MRASDPNEAPISAGMPTSEGATTVIVIVMFFIITIIISIIIIMIIIIFIDYHCVGSYGEALCYIEII